MRKIVEVLLSTDLFVSCYSALSKIKARTGQIEEELEWEQTLHFSGTLINRSRNITRVLSGKSISG